MQSEIHRLYEQKTGKEPVGEIKGFIDGLTIREVARIWSLMGDGGDFIAALQRVVALKITKAGGDMDPSKLADGDEGLEEMIKKLNTQKERQIEEERQIAARAEKAEAAKKEALLRADKEKEAAEKAAKEQAEAEKRAEQEKAAAEVANKAKIEADLAAARAAEEERRAAEAAAAAAAEERVAAEEAMKKAQEALAEMKKQAEEAERLKKIADEKAAAEKAEAERKEALREAAAEKAAAEAAAAEQAAREETELNKKNAEIEEKKQKEKEEEEEELHDETITVTLENPKEPLGLDCLAGAGRVRIIDVSGACLRAGVKSASVLLTVDGHVVDSQETLIEAVGQLRKEEKTVFDVVLQPPAHVSDEDKEILQKYNDQKVEIAQWMEMVEQCKNVNIEMNVQRGIDLIDKGSNRVYCEVKLRQVKGGKVTSGHPNPQKVATPVTCCETKKGSKTLGEAAWPRNEIFRFNSPKNDCIRVSIFANKTFGKEYLGRVDLMLEELLEDLCVGPIVARWQVQGGDEGRGPVGGELELALCLEACDGKKSK
eukprot:TRINITY_DN2226_c0_g3_i1.p1 TRINITY_DN2226_c0_g3~~TRINITY_DN2226_c0_g3_i1.p1  ORF type:complete len:554 (+),score=210.88 TRINITY_DN2226_c0_g3_i1:35-1663(+)